MTGARPPRLLDVLWVLAGGAAALYYFTWLMSPGRAGFVPLFVALVVADLFNGVHAFSFWATCLRGPRRRHASMPADATVDVLIPTYNEPEDILHATVTGALGLRGASVRVLLLDDGERPAIAALADRMGVAYLARSDHRGAKAGNINHALRETADSGAEFVVVLDSDHVPRPEFLERTLGYFVDPAVGLVQTPQIYANAGTGLLARGAAEQQTIFFGPICAGRDGFRSSICCGTGFVARRTALDRAGGFPEDSVTEDIVLSTRLVGLGYDIAYVGEALTSGLGPEDARAYVSQQKRWATGCLELLLRRPSLWGPLSWTQRWQYAIATSYWLSGWTFLVYASLPVVRLTLGQQPVSASSTEFVGHFLPYFLLAVANLGRFTKGGYSIVGLAMNWGSALIHVTATLTVLSGRRIGFAVTPKRARAGGWRALKGNIALVGILVGSAVVGCARGLDDASLNNVVFALIDAIFLGAIVVFSIQQDHARAPAPAPAPAPGAARRPGAVVADPLADTIAVAAATRES